MYRITIPIIMNVCKAVCVIVLFDISCVQALCEKVYIELFVSDCLSDLNICFCQNKKSCSKKAK